MAHGKSYARIVAYNQRFLQKKMIKLYFLTHLLR